jgi:threonine dehydratase
VASNPTIADGLRVTTPGKLTFPIVQHDVKDILLVSDDEMVETLTWMLERMKVLVEPSGAAGAAAVAHRKADFSGKEGRRRALGRQRGSGEADRVHRVPRSGRAAAAAR